MRGQSRLLLRRSQDSYRVCPFSTQKIKIDVVDCCSARRHDVALLAQPQTAPPQGARAMISLQPQIVPATQLTSHQ